MQALSPNSPLNYSAADLPPPPLPPLPGSDSDLPPAPTPQGAARVATRVFGFDEAEDSSDEGGSIDSRRRKNLKKVLTSGDRTGVSVGGPSSLKKASPTPRVTPPSESESPANSSSPKPPTPPAPPAPPPAPAVKWSSDYMVSDSGEDLSSNDEVPEVFERLQKFSARLDTIDTKFTSIDSLVASSLAELTARLLKSNQELNDRVTNLTKQVQELASTTASKASDSDSSNASLLKNNQELNERVTNLTKQVQELASTTVSKPSGAPVALDNELLPESSSSNKKPEASPTKSAHPSASPKGTPTPQQPSDKKPEASPTKSAHPPASPRGMPPPRPRRSSKKPEASPAKSAHPPASPKGTPTQQQPSDKKPKVPPAKSAPNNSLVQMPADGKNKGQRTKPLEQGEEEETSCKCCDCIRGSNCHCIIV